MRRQFLVFALVALVALVAWVSAGQAQAIDQDPVPVPEASSGTTLAVTVAGPGGTSRHLASPQLLSNEIAVLLEHLQSQHVYLKHLENVRRALEKELSIVRLMRECDGFGSTCTGRGIVDKPEPPVVHESPAAAPASGEPPPPPALTPEPAPAPVVHELPIVVGIYRDTASLIYSNRRIEVRRGTKVGPFVVTAVALDRVRLDGPRGEVSLPLRWTPSVLRVPTGGFGEF